MQAALHIPAMCDSVHVLPLALPEIGAAVGSPTPKSQHDGAQVLQVGGAGGTRGVEVRVAEQVLPKGVPGTTRGCNTPTGKHKRTYTCMLHTHAHTNTSAHTHACCTHMHIQTQTHIHMHVSHTCTQTG